MEAMGVSRTSFYAMLELMPPIKWPEPGQSIACKNTYESRLGVCTQKLRDSAEKGRQAKREKSMRTVDGVRGTIKELAAQHAVSVSAVRRRMASGMTLEEALKAVPLQGQRKSKSV